MKKNLKTLLLVVITVVIMSLFIFYPFQCTDLHLKIYFSADSAYTECAAYYTTAANPVYSDSQRLDATVYDGKADIVFSKELCETLTGLRLDFSQSDALIGIERVELCSAGFVQTSLDATDFFAESNILSSNDIAIIQPVKTTVYIGTEGRDSYLLFHSDIVDTCNGAYSHYTGSKLAICVFVILAGILARKQLFTAE